MRQQLTLGLNIPDENTFDNFIVTNNFDQIAQLKKFDQESFVYLHGASGLGSTHLLHACCNAEKNNDAIYLDLKSLPKNPAVFEGLSDLSLCCIDHLETVNDNDTEEALFHLFNKITAKGNRLIIANKTASNQANIRLADLKSRLGSGQSIALQEPDDTAKEMILKQLAQRCGLELSKECIAYLLTRQSRKMSDLISVLKQLDQAAWIEQRRLSIPFIKKCLDENALTVHEI
jgi:DnaA-homolog protein